MKRRADVVLLTAVPLVSFHKVIGTFPAKAHQLHADGRQCHSSELKGVFWFVWT